MITKQNESLKQNWKNSNINNKAPIRDAFIFLSGKNGMVIFHFKEIILRYLIIFLKMTKNSFTLNGCLILCLAFSYGKIPMTD